MSPLQIPTQTVPNTAKPQVSGLPHNQTPTHPPNSGRRSSGSHVLRRRPHTYLPLGQRFLGDLPGAPPYLEAIMSGPEAWEGETTIARAIEILEGVIQNPKILSFQDRAAEYTHPFLVL